MLEDMEHSTAKVKKERKQYRRKGPTYILHPLPPLLRKEFNPVRIKKSVSFLNKTTGEGTTNDINLKTDNTAFFTTEVD